MSTPRHRSTPSELAGRVEHVLQLLVEGVPPSVAYRQIAAEYDVCWKTACRYGVRARDIAHDALALWQEALRQRLLRLPQSAPERTEIEGRFRELSWVLGRRHHPELFHLYGVLVQLAGADHTPAGQQEAATDVLNA